MTLRQRPKTRSFEPICMCAGKQIFLKIKFNFATDHNIFICKNNRKSRFLKFFWVNYSQNPKSPIPKDNTVNRLNISVGFILIDR